MNFIAQWDKVHGSLSLCYFLYCSNSGPDLAVMIRSVDPGASTVDSRQLGP